MKTLFAMFLSFFGINQTHVDIPVMVATSTMIIQEASTTPNQLPKPIKKAIIKSVISSSSTISVGPKIMVSVVIATSSPTTSLPVEKSYDEIRRQAQIDNANYIQSNIQKFYEDKAKYEAVVEKQNLINSYVNDCNDRIKNIKTQISIANAGFEQKTATYNELMSQRGTNLVIKNHWTESYRAETASFYLNMKTLQSALQIAQQDCM